MHVSKHAGLKVPLFPQPHCGWVANGSLSRSRQRRRRSNILSFPLSCGCFPEIRGGKTCPVRRGKEGGNPTPPHSRKRRSYQSKGGKGSICTPPPPPKPLRSGTNRILILFFFLSPFSVSIRRCYSENAFVKLHASCVSRHILCSKKWKVAKALSSSHFFRLCHEKKRHKKEGGKVQSPPPSPFFSSVVSLSLSFSPRANADYFSSISSSLTEIHHVFSSHLC